MSKRTIALSCKGQRSTVVSVNMERRFTEALLYFQFYFISYKYDKTLRYKKRLAQHLLNKLEISIYIYIY